MQRIEEDEIKTTNDIMADMTRQYKATQEELMVTDKNLNARISENDDTIARLKEEKEELIRNKTETE